MSKEKDDNILRLATTKTKSGDICLRESFIEVAERFLCNTLLIDSTYEICSCHMNANDDDLMLDNYYIGGTIFTLMDINFDNSIYIKLGCLKCGVVKLYDFKTFYEAVDNYYENEFLVDDKINYLPVDKHSQLQDIIANNSDKKTRQDKIDKFILDNVPMAKVINIPKNVIKRNYDKNPADVIKLFKEK